MTLPTADDDATNGTTEPISEGVVPPVLPPTNVPVAPTSRLRRIVTWPSRMHHGGFVVLAAMAAMIVTLYFFCPRFVIWKALDYSFGWFNPEVNRAVFTMKKVEKPFEFTTNNAPINWRFLFPLMAHYLHLSRTAFLSLPFLGCWITLAVVCHIGLRDTGSRLTGFLLSAVVATASWFFVSTGWLAYFDSWYVLGMLGFVFFRSYWIVAAASLLTPWVDERFVFMLPMLTACRATYFDWLPRRDWRGFLTTSLLASFLSGAYVAVRLVAHYGEYESATAYNLNEHLSGFESHYLKNIGIGIWNGLRGGWLFVALLLWYASSRKHYVWSALFAVVCLVNVFMMIRVVQGDHSRTASVAVPMLILGVLYLARNATLRTNVVLTVVWIINLLIPAEHVITTFTVPIRYFYAEYDRYFDPPIFLKPDFYTQRGVLLFQQQNFDEAMKEFDTALQIDPKFNQARLNKAIILTLNKKHDEALTVLNEALSEDEDFPEAYYARGLCREAKNQYKEAVTDYKKALDSKKKEWPFRAETERLYKRLRGVGINPIE